MGTVHAKSAVGDPTADSESADVGMLKAARVDKVFIDGVGRTKNDILVKAVEGLLSCKNFQEVLVACGDVRHQLGILGAFKSIDVKIDTSKGPGATPNGYDVTFKVKENRWLTGGVTTLVGNNEGSMVVGGKLPNVFGRGEFIQTEYQYGTKHSSGFNLTASKPYLGTHNTRITGAVYQQAADYPWNAFRETNRGLLTEFSFESLPNIHHAIRWEGVWRELNPLGITVPFPVREQMGHSVKSALKHTLTIDTRDNPILPTEGSFLRASSEAAGGKLGGDIEFIKNEVEHQMNFSLFNGIVLQISSSVGHMTTSGNHNICDKFFLGGPLGLRGFQLRGVGPQCEGASLGGTTYWATGCHLYSPLPFRRGHGFIGEYLRLHGFVTTGSISEGWDLDRLQEPRLSAGLGLALSMGHMARIELNYVVPIKQQNFDKTSRGMQVGIGVSFL